MARDHARGTYGFRFAEASDRPLCSLFAVGHERETNPAYDWNGLTRTDGPLLLFQYSLDGRGELELEGRTHRLEPGQAFLVEIPGPHRYRLPADSPAWEFLYALIRPHWIAPLWEDAKEKLGATPFLPPGSGPILALKDLFVAARTGRIADAYAASEQVYRFLMELTRFAGGKGTSSVGWPPAVRSAVHYIDRHYDRMAGQEQLAAELGLSKYHFLRTFAKHVGMTPNDYVSRVRVEKAVELLRRTDWSVDRIAREIGYSSGSYFIKVFRKLTDMTPARFRSGEELPYSRLFFD